MGQLGLGFCGYLTNPLLQYLTATMFFTLIYIKRNSAWRCAKAFLASLLDSTMADHVVEASRRRQVRQPPSVPFLWEERPGVAKKGWKPETSVFKPVVTPPVKLIASVPFSWEEKPGKPLSFSSQPPNETLLAAPVQLITSTSPQTLFHGCEKGKYSSNDGDNESKSDGRQGPLHLELESFSFGTNDSISSAPSLLENCLVPSEEISTAVPVQKLPLIDVIDQSEDTSSPDSDTDSSTSSYATGVSSLAGTEFLECLFPLYSPNSGLRQNIRDSNKGIVNPPAQNSRDSYRERNSSVTFRRPHTLGELIMMSRRRSCQRKADCKIDRSSQIGKFLAASSLEPAPERLKVC